MCRVPLISMLCDPWPGPLNPYLGGTMLRLTDDQRRAMEGLLPPEALAFLQGSGVPEVVVFRLIDHTFRLDLEPLLNGDAFRIGQVDGGWYAMGVKRTTGHFGYAFARPSSRRGVSSTPPWSASFVASRRPSSSGSWRLPVRSSGMPAENSWSERFAGSIRWCSRMRITSGHSWSRS
jgi:hypothetical protein